MDTPEHNFVHSFPDMDVRFTIRDMFEQDPDGSDDIYEFSQRFKWDWLFDHWAGYWGGIYIRIDPGGETQPTF